MTSEEEVYDEEGSRRSRGLLASDIARVCVAYVAGDFTLDEGKYLTPYVAAKVLKELDELDSAPSSGAVSSVFERWEKVGFATFRKNPFAFVGFTERGAELGHTQFMDETKKTAKIKKT